MNKKTIVALFLSGAIVGGTAVYSWTRPQKEEPVAVKTTQENQNLDFIIRMSLSPTRGYAEAAYELVLDSRDASALYYKPYDKENSDDKWINQDKLNEVKHLLDQINFDNLFNSPAPSPGSEASTRAFSINYKGKSKTVGLVDYLVKNDPELNKLLELGKKIEKITGFELYLD